MAESLSCTVRSSKGTSFDDVVLSVTVPSPSGQVQILPGHAEAYVALADGVLTAAMPNGDAREVPVQGGVVHVKDDRVIVVL